MIGSFIGAAFSRPFNESLFQIGVLSYATYVLLFPGLVGMLTNARLLTTARDDFADRRARFNEILFPEKVNELVGTRVQDTVRSYWRWFTFVALLYVAVAGAAVFAAVVVPDAIT